MMELGLGWVKRKETSFSCTLYMASRCLEVGAIEAGAFQDCLTVFSKVGGKGMATGAVFSV